MIRIKSVHPGRVVIPDAGLRFKAGQVVSVESLSPQIQDMIEKGYLVKLPSEEHSHPEASAQPKTSHKDSLLHSYKTNDTLHIDGQLDKAGILLQISGKPLWVSGQAFDILLKLAVRLKNDHSGWFYGTELVGVNYHVAIMRLRKQIASSLKNPASEFIENNGYGAYRISTPPHNVSFDAAKIKALHSELHIHTLLASVDKTPSAP